MSVNQFVYRHIGPRPDEINKMTKRVGLNSLDELIDKTVPPDIRLQKPLELADGISEYEYLNRLRDIARKNKIFRSYIGMGYYGTILPPVIQRNVLENPAWYTSYTPYQAEISQGRLEALLNFQTVITELTGMEIANASLLDEGTAAAEAMIMMFNARSKEAVKDGKNTFFADENILPQTLDVLKTRSEALGIRLITGRYDDFALEKDVYGIMVQYPDKNGQLRDYRKLVESAHASGITLAVSADILSLAILTPPGEWGADVVFGSTQRLGIPMGYGGPHAAYFAVRDSFRRFLPGRIIGVTVDRHGRYALRMALQTREQHIKRERATSNICTAQALLATMTGLYAVYHGAEGLRNIALTIHRSAGMLEQQLSMLGCKQRNRDYFDTLDIELSEKISVENLRSIAIDHEINFLYSGNKSVRISLDETVTIEDLNRIVDVFSRAVGKHIPPVGKLEEKTFFNEVYNRRSQFLQHEVFRRFQSETEMMRYIKRLERKDFSLTHSMISLGSCTMKLNAAVEMFALSWPEFGNIHPFVPLDQAEGYHQLFFELGNFLKVITGFEAISFQPNSGAAGEYAGLMVIRKYHQSRGEGGRNVVLIPASAHGTNPASAAMAGMEVVVVRCDDHGNIDIGDLKEKVLDHKAQLAAFMITYPSTHGVFESAVRQMAEIIHDAGGQVYMDGANMNAQVGLTNPALIGADVCHLNLHKTFAIPHGGGGPGMGPIAVADHLVEFLPTHPVIPTGGINGTSAVASAPFGSASILTISHAYCCLLGGEGLTMASKIAILNANYIAARVKDYYSVLYKGENGYVAHEMILDCREFKQTTEITETDIAKRLMDYGFHAPTLSFPVHGTLMVEPTESESMQELDRFTETLIAIHHEITEVKNSGNLTDNVLKNAPHTQEVIAAEEWNHSYSRCKAAFPLPWVADNKFWPGSGRVDDAYGDRNLVCTCAPIDAYRFGEGEKQ
ncbi:MAG: aminomethyl-transferring glycine dehydrogenase [Bacteroidales bacterium]|nr:aminomethyl-transferring glycine dehydrogenase [Bacteroidales bacterium]